MAEVLTEWPTTVSRDRYPWDQWFDGRVWRLTKGIDFQLEAKRFAAVVRSTAHKRGLKVRCYCLEGDVILQIIPVST